MDKQTLIRLLTQKLQSAISEMDDKKTNVYMPAAGKTVAYETAIELVRQLPD